MTDGLIQVPSRDGFADNGLVEESRRFAAGGLVPRFAKFGVRPSSSRGYQSDRKWRWLVFLILDGGPVGIATGAHTKLFLLVVSVVMETT